MFWGNRNDLALEWRLITQVYRNVNMHEALSFVLLQNVSYTNKKKVTEKKKL